jgi:replicative DNA helicase
MMHSVESEVFGPLPKDTENAIIACEYMVKRKRNVLTKMERKTELTENEKIKIGAEYDFIKNVEHLIKAFKRTFHASLGKLPPCDLDYEEAILGALMLHSIDGQDSALGKGVGPAPIKSIRSFLKPEHFYMAAHEIIYTTILELFDAGQPIDMRAVKDRLRKKGQLEVIGGAYKLADLTSKVSSSASMDYWGRVLVEFAMKRELIMVCSDSLNKLFDDTEDVFNIIDGIKEAFEKVEGWKKK